MKMMKMLQVFALSSLLVGAMAVPAYAMVNENGEPVSVPSSPDEVVILMTPADDVVPINEEAMDGASKDGYMPEAAEDGRMYKGDEKPVILVHPITVVLEKHEAYVKNNHVMIPMRKTLETMGYSVQWDAKNLIVTYKKGDFSGTAVIGKDEYLYANEKIYTFARIYPRGVGMAPEIKNGRTFVPLEFVQEILAASVFTDEDGLISITPDVSMFEPVYDTDPLAQEEPQLVQDCGLALDDVLVDPIEGNRQ